jgi:hypothetical protein
MVLVQRPGLFPLPTPWVHLNIHKNYASICVHKNKHEQAKGAYTLEANLK